MPVILTQPMPGMPEDNPLCSRPHECKLPSHPTDSSEIANMSVFGQPAWKGHCSKYYVPTAISLLHTCANLTPSRSKQSLAAALYWPTQVKKKTVMIPSTGHKTPLGKLIKNIGSLNLTPNPPKQIHRNEAWASAFLKSFQDILLSGDHSDTMFPPSSAEFPAEMHHLKDVLSFPTNCSNMWWHWW